jgi:membrane protein YqaA with SNARE-associated domain
MESLLADLGYPALFALSFLAATILPLGSEWLLVIMLLGGDDPVLTVAVATAGNLLGACSTWAVGFYGAPFLIRRVLRVDAATQAKAERLYRRYGFWSLLFSWLPFLGDPLCLVAGVLRVDLARFVALVFVSKLGRYAAVAWLTLAGGSFLGFTGS